MKLPKFIYSAIQKHNTSVGDNKAFPDRNDVSFDYVVLKNRYNEVIDEVKQVFGYIPEISEAESMLSRLLKDIREKEEPIRPQLEKLCEAIVNTALGVPQETILLDCRIVSSIEPDNELRILPEYDEKEPSYTFDDVEELSIANDIILKRRLTNSLVQGVSYLLMLDYFDNEQLYEWSKELPTLYTELIALNDFLLFNKKEKITDDNPMLGAYVETHLGKEDEKTVISAQGLCYPLLLQETFRGFFELFASHGLPSDTKKAMYIIRHADFIMAEAWDLRIGVPLWELIENTQLKKIRSNIYPYIFSSIVQLKLNEFNNILQNIFAKTNKGKEYISNIIDEVLYDEEYNTFKNDIQRFNIERAMLADDEYDSSYDNDVIEESIITEGVLNKNVNAAKDYIMQKLGYNEEQAMNYIGFIKAKIDGARVNKCKFLLAVSRMMIDNEIDSMNKGNLNQTLEIVGNSEYANNLNQDLNGLSCDDFINQFKEFVSQEIQRQKDELSNQTFNRNNDYTIVKINSTEEASKYGEYVSWCITTSQEMYDEYTSDGLGVFYFCLKNGFENIKKEKTENYPLDEYGLSMIAVSVNFDGSWNTITCRWNKGIDGTRDTNHIMNPQELSNLIGANFYDTFKPRTKEEVFDSGKFHDGFAIVHRDDYGYNFVSIDNKLLSPMWFNSVDDFNEGFARVRKDYQENFIGTDGKFLSEKWFDDVDYCFINGLAKVKEDDKENVIRTDGTLVFNEFHDYLDDISDNVYKIFDGEDWNLINTDNQLLCDEWYYNISDPRCGIMQVENENGFNFINMNGKLLSKVWFESAFGFRNYGAVVKLDGKYNILDTNGNFLYDTWFDCLIGHGDWLSVVLNDKYNYLDKNYKLISDEWFDTMREANDAQYEYSKKNYEWRRKWNN
jgi:hypothetical protein